MLIRTSRIAAVSLLVALLAGGSTADEVRYFDGEDGITYRETRQVVRHSLPETRMEQRESITYRPQYTSELKETQRSYMAPVTEYQWQPYMERTWNPFAAPTLTYRLVPQTHWEPRSETVRIPVTHCDVVPEKHVVQVPVTTLRIAEAENVTRVPVGVRATTNPAASPAGSKAARGTTVGGISKIENDPPKQSSNWHAADAAIQR
jgi:hypothetical protein